MAKKSLKSALTTRTGKTLLGPLNVQQLIALQEKSSKPKHRAKINRRIAELKSRPGYTEPVMEAVPEEVTP
jgi:hypothetical protein